MSAFPSDEALLQFIKDNPGQSGKREVSRAFGIKGADRITLKQRLKTLKERGLVASEGKHFRAAGSLPDVFPALVVSVDDHGDLVVMPRLHVEDGEPQRFIMRARGGGPRGRGRVACMGVASAAPGVGDAVLVRMVHEGDDSSPGERIGEVKLIKAIGRAQVRQYGVLRVPSQGSPYIEPVERKADTLSVAPHDLGGAVDGDLVAVVQLPGHGRNRRAEGKVEEVFGQLGSERAISQIAVLRQGLPDVFSGEVEAQAEALVPAKLEGREDWRALAFITIDPGDAKDHDDAVHVAPDEDDANKGGFIVSVAIADVAHYVRPHTLIDREARERGNSVYFPDRVIPMLPERLSTDLCSLRAGQERPALAIRMVFSADGSKRAQSLHRVWIRLHAGLAYEAAQAAIDESLPPDGITPCPPDIAASVLKPLWAAYRALHQARERRAPLHLDLPERKLVLDTSGKVRGVRVPERLDAHRLIEEFMIQANVAAAELLEARKTGCMYRVHDGPSAAKFEGLREFLKSLNMSIAAKGSLRPADFNGILAKAVGHPNETLINEMVLRSQAQAEYTPDNIGHFGLNLGRYAHFTSPIRRYADLLVHRALLQAYGLGDGGDSVAASHEVLLRLGDHLSGTERRAMLAERETVDRLIAAFLSDQVGARFEGRITGVVGAGLFVRLRDTGADGFVPVSTLGMDYFSFDEAGQKLVGSASGLTYQLGDSVEVRLVEVAPLAGALRFEMLSEGKPGKALGRARKPVKGSRPSGKPGNSSPAGHARQAVRKAVRKAKGR